MKKLKKLVFSPAGTVVMFVLAIGLLMTSSVGGARAALTYYSETYDSQVELKHIGVSLLENGEVVSSRNYADENRSWWGIGDQNNEFKGELLTTMLKTDEATGETETLKPGVAYPEELAVKNTGTIDEYVRVTLYRYWDDEEKAKSGASTKLRELDPEWIDLNLTGNGWVEDTGARTAERIVLYYTKKLAVNDTSAPLSDTLTIDENLNKTKVTYEGKKVITTYEYDGVTFHLKAEVDAVQDHNAKDAILSAWGRNVTISDGVLSLQ